jgi:hypothetical protein
MIGPIGSGNLMGTFSNSLNLYLHVDDVAPHRRVVGRIGGRRHVPLQDRADFHDVFEKAEFPERVEVAAHGITDGLLAGDVVDADARDADVVPHAVVEQVHVESDVFERSRTTDVAGVAAFLLGLHHRLEPVVRRVQSDADHLLESGVPFDDLDGFEVADFEVAEVVGVLQEETLEPGAFDLDAGLLAGLLVGTLLLGIWHKTSLGRFLGVEQKFATSGTTPPMLGSNGQPNGSVQLAIDAAWMSDNPRS